MSCIPRLPHLGHAELAKATHGERAKIANHISRTATMKNQQPIIQPDDNEHRVLKFVPRNSAALQNNVVPSAADDLSRYERPRDETDDFRHRMIANAAAFALTALLIGIGIWLAISIADLRKTQDCVLMGRRDCARIVAPHG
jgi:hypothetical protein